MANNLKKLRSPKPTSVLDPGFVWMEFYKRDGEWVPVPKRSITIAEYLSKTSNEATRWDPVLLQKGKRTVAGFGS
jgi:hypothetical protein